MDYYKILNLKEDATLKEIEQAYLDLSSFYNPENNVSKLAYKKYREIKKAYNVLKEIKQREMYNLIRKADIVSEKIEEDGNVLEYDDFSRSSYKREDISKFKDVLVSDLYSDYTKIELTIPYLYYLVNSEYKVEYLKNVVVSSESICDVCLGIGKVKKEDKIVVCDVCLGTGKKVVIREEKVSKDVIVSEEVIDNDDKLIVKFDFKDKDEYVVNGNEINFKHVVSEQEYYNGIYFYLYNNDNELLIEETNFDNLVKSYVFLDKVINIEYVLKEYKGKDKYGYIVSNRDVIYMNPKDYTYSFTSSDTFTLKVELNDNIVTINDLGTKGYNKENGNLIVEVIKLNNEDNLQVFFDREIKKVSANLFKFKGTYNKHKFSYNKSFDYDDDYIYIPNKAYTLKLKYYSLFRILFISMYLIIPFILFLVLGVSYAFFISSFVVLIVYVIGVNLLMEVKI